MVAESIVPSDVVPDPRGAALRSLRNVLSNWGGFLFAAVVNFFLAPFVVRHLGNSLYGISVLILSITGYLGLLDLGVRGTMTRYVARYRARAEHQECSLFVSSALAIFGCAGLSVVLFSLFAVVWSASFSLIGLSSTTLRLLLFLGGLNVAASLISGVFSGIPMALQRFDYVNVIAVCSTAVRALAIVLVLKAGGGLIGLVWIQLLYTVAATLASAWISFHLYPELRIRLGKLYRRSAELILSFTAYSFVLFVFDVLLMYLNSIVVGAFSSVQMVTFFWIAASLVNYSRALLSGISKISTPLASELEALGDQRGLQRAMLEGARYSTLLGLPIALTFLLRGSSFIALWMGPEYGSVSGQVLRILALGLAVSASTQVGVAVLLGVSRHRPLVPLLLAQAICSLALSVSWIRSAGLVGVAWSITLPYLATSFFFWPWYVRRCLGVPIRTYLLTIWIRPAMAMLPFALTTLVVERIWPTRSLLLFFTQTGAMLPVAASGYWYLGYTRSERRGLREALVRPAARAAWVSLRGSLKRGALL